ncbi:uncharacterized protein N7484_001469 [Penicillium longicatenatum]|uniref:uncharacterized protein n=1 Tax=Penicillium longicatenatum TaxID=1561947 RepID=UPI0025470029|nr:uncharacterized protein N7484_001469 [Penicillium longicatenatum]KAJ5657820.1 hypothetical protein N7484_001469 [Penicillium longicatenatum]
MKFVGIALDVILAAVATAGAVPVAERSCTAANGACTENSQCCSGACGTGQYKALGKCSP